MLLLRRHEKDLFLNIGDAAEVARRLALWRESRGRIDAALDQTEAAAKLVTDGSTADDQQAVRTVRSGVVSYTDAFTQIVARIQKGEITDPVSANKEMEPHKDSIRKTEAAIDELVAGSTKTLQGLEKSLQDHVRSIVGLMLL